jgi:hypothetical protein
LNAKGIDRLATAVRAMDTEMRLLGVTLFDHFFSSRFLRIPTIVNDVMRERLILGAGVSI